MTMQTQHQTLIGQQLQWLIDRFNLRVDLKDGVIVASRRDGATLKASTVAKMVGLKFTPDNWREEAGRVRGLYLGQYSDFPLTDIGRRGMMLGKSIV